MKPKNIIIYDSWFDIFETQLTDEQVGKFIKSIGRWKNGDELTSDDAEVRGMLFAIKRDLIGMEENYQKKVNTNRENGSKGGRPKKPTITQENPNNPIGYSITQPNPQNLKEKEKEKEKDIEKYKVKEKEYINTSNNMEIDTYIQDLYNKKVENTERLKKQKINY
jgi:hypothetical protein